MMNSNLNSAFYMCHYALPHLRRHTEQISRHPERSEGSSNYSRILNIGYTGAEHFRSYPTTTAYQAAKAGLLTLTKGLAKAEAPNNILVNMLSPGHLENSVGPYNLENIGLGRLATLDEACSVAELLITHTYLTGQNIEVAGGWGL
jgi:3-oxoacyl-[acyl-carrier protein] reductase